MGSGSVVTPVPGVQRGASASLVGGSPWQLLHHTAGKGLLPCSGVSDTHCGGMLMLWGTVRDRTRVVLWDP